MANASSNRREEGCGKWLTKRSKSTMKQQHSKPCLTRTLKPIIFEGRTKSCKMKQSRMSQFLVEKTTKERNKIISNNGSASIDKVNNIVLSLKKGFSSTDIKYEDLWGSDSDENEICENKDNIEKVSKEKQNILRDVPIVCQDAQIENNFQTNYVGTKNVICSEMLFTSPKRLQTCKNNADQDIGAESNSAENEFNFTEWFEHEAGVFNIQCYNEGRGAVNKENLLSISCCKPSDSEEELPQFSEWFNENIQRELLSSPAREVSQHNSTFTQWFEANLENIKSPS